MDLWEKTEPTIKTAIIIDLHSTWSIVLFYYHILYSCVWFFYFLIISDSIYTTEWHCNSSHSVRLGLILFHEEKLTWENLYLEQYYFIHVGAASFINLLSFRCCFFFVLFCFRWLPNSYLYSLIQSLCIYV